MFLRVKANDKIIRRKITSRFTTCFDAKLICGFDTALIKIFNEGNDKVVAYDHR